MNRRKFIKQSSAAFIAMQTLSSFKNTTNDWKFTDEKMPVLFVGHGNPMNAIEKNEYHLKFQEIGTQLTKPKAILCISAHWETKGTFVTAMEKPKTIHDFGGFPQTLFDQQYPAPGSPDLAKEIKGVIKKVEVGLNNDWGLDHGCWSVLLPMFPKADIPVLQLSIDYSQGPQYHYDLAKELASLRKKGVLIIGSGNIVHNLGLVQWKEGAYDWTIEFDAKMKEFMDKGDHASVINYQQLGKSAALAVPTNEHFLPVLYSLALQDKGEGIKYFNEKNTMGSISMRSVIIGK